MSDFSFSHANVFVQTSLWSLGKHETVWSECLRKPSRKPPQNSKSKFWTFCEPDRAPWTIYMAITNGKGMRYNAYGSWANTSTHNEGEKRTSYISYILMFKFRQDIWNTVTYQRYLSWKLHCVFLWETAWISWCRSEDMLVMAQST